MFVPLKSARMISPNFSPQYILSAAVSKAILQPSTPVMSVSTFEPSSEERRIPILSPQYILPASMVI